MSQLNCLSGNREFPITQETSSIKANDLADLFPPQVTHGHAQRAVLPLLP